MPGGARCQNRADQVLEKGHEGVREGVQQAERAHTARVADHGLVAELLLHPEKAGRAQLRVRVQDLVRRVHSLRVHTLHPQPAGRRGHAVLRVRPPAVQGL